MGEAFISSRGGKAIMLSGVGTLHNDGDDRVYAQVSNLPWRPSYIFVSFRFSSGGTTYYSTGVYDSTNERGYSVSSGGIDPYSSPYGFTFGTNYFRLTVGISVDVTSSNKFYWAAVK